MIKRALEISNSEWIYTWAVALGLAITTLFANLYGMLSPDSLGYLALAESVQKMQGCTIDGKYYAIQPCGYSILVAIVGKLIGIDKLIFASKLLNWILIFSSFLLQKKTMPSIALATLIVVNPFTLYILEYTWSENLFLLAFAGCFYVLVSIKSSGSSKYKLVFLTAFLILGCLSRYFFGPFAAIIWIASYIAFGSEVAKKSLLPFVIAGIFFLAYQKLNIYISGYGTGMERINAPESIKLLGLVFIWTIIKYFLVMTFITAPFYYLGFEEKRNSDNQLIPQYSSYKFLLLCGLGFLTLAFIFRSQIQYDMFDRRTIGYGVIFVFIGILGLKAKKIDQLNLRKKVTSLILLFVTSFILSISITGWSFIFRSPYITPSNLIENNQSTVMNQAIVTFKVPSPSFFISGDSQYYHYGAQIISVATSPYSRQDDYDSFIKKLEWAPEDCVLDFSNIQDLEEFEEILSGEYLVDVKFEYSYMPLKKVYMPTYNLELKKFLIEIFKSKSLLSCHNVLSYAKNYRP